MSHELAHWRGRFPLVNQKTYLASHSLGAVPASAADALQDYFQQWSELGILAWDDPWWAAVTDFSGIIEKILNASSGTVVPMLNVTRGMAAVASCFNYDSARNGVVLTDIEFTTSYPFWRGQETLGARITVVPSDDGISVPTQRIIDAIDDTTLICPLSHVYFRSGAVQDLASITRAAHKYGAYVMGDGYQAVGTLPVDVTELGVDFYVGGSHKWLCGGPGAAYLYVRDDLISQLQPRLTGWFGLRNPFEYEPGSAKPDPNEGVFRFLAGTTNVPGLYAAREGLKIVSEIGPSAIRRVSSQLTKYVIAEAKSRNFDVKTPHEPSLRSGMVCIDFPGAKEAQQTLEHQGIILDWRPDCGIRVSPHFYSLQADIDTFFGALDAL